MILLEHVSKVIKGNTVINDVSIELKPGEVTGLKGVNGSGKTMLLRLISGLICPTAGAIYINGERLGKDITFPNSIGILIENPAFLDSYSGFQNLKILASIKGLITDEDICTAIERVGLDCKDRKKYRKYSLGMKQRWGISAAIMEHPEIILLDEPTNALDSEGVELVKKIVMQEKTRGAVVVIACHDADILRELTDEVYLVEEGKVSAYAGQTYH